MLLLKVPYIYAEHSLFIISLLQHFILIFDKYNFNFDESLDIIELGYHT